MCNGSGQGGMGWIGVVRMGLCLDPSRTISLPIPAMPLTAFPARSAALAIGISLAATCSVCSDCLEMVYGQGPSFAELCFSKRCPTVKM